MNESQKNVYRTENLYKKKKIEGFELWLEACILQHSIAREFEFSLIESVDGMANELL
jgi:hypothetical protein